MFETCLKLCETCLERVVKLFETCLALCWDMFETFWNVLATVFNFVCHCLIHLWICFWNCLELFETSVELFGNLVGHVKKCWNHCWYCFWNRFETVWDIVGPVIETVWDLFGNYFDTLFGTGLKQFQACLKCIWNVSRHVWMCVPMLDGRKMLLFYNNKSTWKMTFYGVETVVAFWMSSVVFETFSHTGCQFCVWNCFHTLDVKKGPCGPRGRNLIAQSWFVSVSVYVLFENPWVLCSVCERDVC